MGEEGLESVGEELDPPEPSEIPDASRRPIGLVGRRGPREWGLGVGAFGYANGRYLSTLMRRLDAPLPSRWTQILLRRALLSRVPAPSFVHPVDWVAERAWLLLRMGEEDGARDRKSVGVGKRGSVRVDLGGRRVIKKKKNIQ